MNLAILKGISHLGIQTLNLSRMRSPMLSGNFLIFIADRSRWKRSLQRCPRDVCKDFILVLHKSNTFNDGRFCRKLSGTSSIRSLSRISSAQIPICLLQKALLRNNSQPSSSLRDFISTNQSGFIALLTSFLRVLIRILQRPSFNFTPNWLTRSMLLHMSLRMRINFLFFWNVLYNSTACSLTVESS